MDYKKLPAREIEHLARTLHPGSWAIEAERPLSTLLGSCVAVCLFDPQARLGGLNHFMLPNIRRGSSAPTDSLLSGVNAMAALLDALLRKGANKRSLQAKAFGGGRIFDTSAPSMDIGERNATFAREWLRREGIPLVTADLLGPWSRKILFLPDTGDAFCRRMATSMATAELHEPDDSDHCESLAQKPKTTKKKIEIFKWLNPLPSPIKNSPCSSA